MSQKTLTTVAAALFILFLVIGTVATLANIGGVVAK